MAQINQFTYGWLPPALAVTIAFVGAFLALVCTSRARECTTTGAKVGWLIMAAWSMGGTGMWVMHFTAMIGFTVPDLPLRYDVPTTIASWLVAVLPVAAGLLLVGLGRLSVPKIVFAGVVLGVGMTGMHFLSLSAIRVAGTVTYDPKTVVSTAVMSSLAGTAELWLTATVRRAVTITATSAVVAVGSCISHYVGMFAVRIVPGPPPKPIVGITPVTLLVPIVAFVVIVVITLFYALLNRSIDSRDDIMMPSLGQSGLGQPA